MKNKKQYYKRSKPTERGKEVRDVPTIKPSSKAKFSQKHYEYKTQSFYGTAAWKKTRASYLKDSPLCERCKENGVIKPAVLVHHKHPLDKGGEQLDRDNLKSLCGEMCHRAEHREIEEKIAAGLKGW